MNHRTSAEYPHKLSQEAGELLLQFDKRIRELSGVEFSSDAHEYIAYKAPGTQNPCVYSDRRKSRFVVRLDIPFNRITKTIDPKGWCERGNAFPAFYEGSKLLSHVMVHCDSTSRIEYIIKVIQQVFSLKSKSKHSRPVDLIERAPSSNRHAEIVNKLDHVHDVVEGIANQIRRAFPPQRDKNTGELVQTDAVQCATELLDCVCKLQVVLGEDLYEDDSNDAE